jgi:hypothetical protein
MLQLPEDAEFDKLFDIQTANFDNILLPLGLTED